MADQAATADAPIDPIALRRAFGTFVTGVTVITTRDADGMKAHLCGVLDRQMAEPAQAEHGNDVARSCPTVSQGVVGSETGAQ